MYIINDQRQIVCMVVNPITVDNFGIFVCVEVLRPSQPIGVMSSASTGAHSFSRNRKLLKTGLLASAE